MKSLLKQILSLGVVLMGLSAGAGQAADLTKITYATSGSGFANGLPLLAKEKGFFEEEGLDVEIVVSSGGTETAAALAGGSIQVASMSFSHVVDAVEAGVDLIAFANTATQAASKLVMRKAYADEKGVTKDSTVDAKIKALKGAKVGVTNPGSGTDRFLRAALALGGLDPTRDVEIVYAGTPAAMAALQAGQLDGFVGPNPNGQLAEHNGFGIVMLSAAAGDVPDFHNLPNTVQATSSAHIAENREIIEKVMRALFKARAYIDSNFEDSLALMQKAYYPDESVDVLRVAAADDWQNGLSEDFRLAEADARRFATLTLDHDLSQPFDKYFTDQFLKK